MKESQAEGSRPRWERDRQESRHGWGKKKGLWEFRWDGGGGGDGERSVGVDVERDIIL